MAKNRVLALLFTFLVCAFLVGGPLLAGNGHLLHGVGAINSSMGGAGTGQPLDVIGALHLNPALLTQLDGVNVGISVELFVDDLSLSTQEAGESPVTTDSDGEPGVLPAVGWSLHKPGKNWAVGWGLLGVAGFRTNWPVDPDSLLLAPQPIGFGRLNTELQVTKVPFAAAWQVNDNLSLGGSLNLVQSRLIINPLPVVEPDCLPAVEPFQNEDCYRPSTGVMVSEIAFSAQLGLFYRFNPQWSLGVSYTSELDTDPYQWNSFHVNPNITTGPNAFGHPQVIEIDLDQPPIATAGLGFTPGPALKFALDIRWVGYASTQGIGGDGGIDDRQRLVSIGWDDILAYMFGVEWQKSPTLTLRAGLNFNDSPIRESVTLNSGGTPSVFEEHYTVGASLAVYPGFNLDFGAYYTPENEITGPFTGVPGATVTLRNSIVSALVGFSFHF